MAVGRHVFAVEIEGTVVEATETTAKIQSAAEAIPNIGDPVEIYFAVPGVKDKVSAASGKVKEISGKLIVVVIDKKNAKVVAGLNARITASAPRLILCTLMRGGRMKLVLVRDDGIEVKRLTDNISRDTYANWSPDGKKIVFSSSDQNGAGLFVLDSEGGKVKRLTYGTDGGAAWSPNGKTIAFTRYNSRNGGQVLAIHADGTSKAKPAVEGIISPAAEDAVTELTDGSNYDADLAWSPDGTKIVFASDRSGTFRLYVMDPDGHNVRELTQVNNPGGNAYPAWSPDGKRIAYTNSAPDGSRQIFVIDADGKNTKQLTVNGNFNCYAAWSPDGKKIAYMSFDAVKSKGSLALMNPDGSEQKIICRDQGVGHNGRPAWKPK
jgi:TolB protein